jgi:protein-L-isoaspartate(D-aspartate) O-methyltransferase
MKTPIQRPEDSFKHQGMRRKMIADLQAKKVGSQPVWEAMMRVPRHFFLDKAFLNQAYSDMAFRIGAGQTISQPSTVAYQSAILEVAKGEKVLEIGTGSGYQTCVLLELGAKVFSVERQKELYDKTGPFLQAIGYGPKLFYGDGYKGLPAYAPFDKILVTCGAPFVPQDLLDQLKPGGTMVIPVGAGEVQKMLRIRKHTDGQVEQETLRDFRFVPMLENKNWGD